MSAFFEKLTITKKLFVIVMVPVMTALLLACSFLFIFDVALLNRGLRQQIHLGAQFVAGQAGGPLRQHDQGRAEHVLNMLREDDRIVAACLYDAQGKVFARYFRNQEPFPFPPSPPGRAESIFRGGRLHEFHQIMALDPKVSPEERVIGTLYLEADISYFNMRMKVYTLAVGLVALVCGAIAFVFAGRLQRIISEPIMRLALLAKVVGEERDYSVRAIPKTEDEIGHLAREFNDMLTEIEKRDRALQAAHDQLEERVSRRTKELQREILEHKGTAANLKLEVQERKRAEEEAHRAQTAAETASRSKGDFLANMSHEIRTPMNGIIGMAELLLNTDLNPVQRKYAGTVRRSGRSLLKIIGDILDFSKVEAGQLVIDPIPFDLQVACEDVIELLSNRAEEKGLSLILRYAPEAPRRVIGDAGRIRQVLTNLAANGLKFTHQGYVLVNVECEKLTSHNATMRISVEDTGIGTPPDKMDQIFDKFAQADASMARQYGGTGLGLTISKQLVELMGGNIGVASRAGEGSRFYFTLDLPQDLDAPPVPKPETDLTGVRLLIVEQSSVQQRILLELADSWGMRAQATTAFSDAAQQLAQAHEQSDPYGMVLLDDQVAGVRDGEFAASCRDEAWFTEVLLVLLASMGQRGDAQRMVKLGFSAYLARPVRERELLEVFATIWAARLHGEDLGLVTRYTVAEHREQERPISAASNLHLDARVLVAEDNFVNQQVAIEILESFGCHVSLAPDGAEALARVKAEGFDIILMDCQMPRMDGFTATAEILRHWGNEQHTPIIAMTAHAMKGDRERCIGAGMDDYVSKPIDPESVLKVLWRWLPEDRFARHRPRPKSGPLRPQRPPRSKEPEVVDISQALWVTGGKLETFERIAQVFLKHAPVRIRELDAAVETRNWEEVSRLAHSLKGATASIGGARLEEAALNLELRAGAGAEKATLEELYDVVKREFKQVCTFIESLDWNQGAEALTAAQTLPDDDGGRAARG